MELGLFLLAMLIVFAVLALLFTRTSKNSETRVENQAQGPYARGHEAFPTISNLSLLDLHKALQDSEMTTIQREAWVGKHDYSRIQWSGIVEDVWYHGKLKDSPPMYNIKIEGELSEEGKRFHESDKTFNVRFPPERKEKMMSIKLGQPIIIRATLVFKPDRDFKFQLTDFFDLIDPEIVEVDSSEQTLENAGA